MGFPFKKIAKGALMGMRIAAPFIPVLGQVATGAQLGIRFVTMFGEDDPTVQEAMTDLIQFIHELKDGGASEDEMYREGTARFREDYEQAVGREASRREIETVYWNAVGHVEGNVGVDSVEKP